MYFVVFNKNLKGRLDILLAKDLKNSQLESAFTDILSLLKNMIMIWIRPLFGYRGLIHVSMLDIFIATSQC